MRSGHDIEGVFLQKSLIPVSRNRFNLSLEITLRKKNIINFPKLQYKEGFRKFSV